jgi:hypothetical protein
MKKVIFSILLMACFGFSRKEDTVQPYSHGQNGMELVAHSKKETIIISTFNSKMTIRRDIALKVYDLYLENKLPTNSKITVNGSEANVTGKCIIKKKKNLTDIYFYYETVDWNNGLKEIYKRA